MTKKLSLPELPTSNMFVGFDKPMTIEWQEFFRTLFKRVGGVSSPTITDAFMSSISKVFDTPIDYDKKINEVEKKLFLISESVDSGLDFETAAVLGTL